MADPSGVLLFSAVSSLFVYNDNMELACFASLPLLARKSSHKATKKSMIPKIYVQRIVGAALYIPISVGLVIL